MSKIILFIFSLCSICCSEKKEKVSSSKDEGNLNEPNIVEPTEKEMLELEQIFDKWDKGKSKDVDQTTRDE